ncbi:MAG: site-specific integrase [Ginsengibacter sp.]
MSNYNIFAAPRGDKKDVKGFTPVYVYIYEGARLISKKSTGQKINADLWNNDARTVGKKHTNATLINSVISKEINELKVKVLENALTGGNFADALIKEKANNLSFFEFSENQITQKNYAPETRRAYRIFLEKIKAVKPYLKLSEINYKFLQSYESHLRDVLKNDINTIWGNMKFINTMMNDAVKLKYLNENPFNNYVRPKYKQTRREFLNLKELQLIEEFREKTNDKDLNIVANYFLFMAFTGLRYSDATRVNNSHVLEGQRIVIETQKTKQTANIYLNDKIKPLLAFILENRLVISQADFNRKLKLIVAYCGIHKKVSSHTGRHSFGAALVALGVPEKSAQGLLAHGNAASTKIYYHLENPVLDEAMKKFNKK